jgi:ribonuclease P protein component
VDKHAGAGREAGFAIPKRLARRAVTRNLIRRQMRAALTSRPAGPGIWLCRLVRAFEPRQFVSATSMHLRAAIRRELDDLMGQAGFA